jgi:aconitate hydratase
VDLEDQDGNLVAYPDTCVGTDSHTTMVNGLGVLGWGVGGIEAEAAMLGQPVSMLIPEVVGFKFTGQLQEGVTATDLVLTATNMLRKHGVVGRFVEYFGPGLAGLTLADRATLANMAPEYGATCGFFGIDEKTLDYMRLTGRDEDQIALVEAYAKEQGFWIDPRSSRSSPRRWNSTCRPSCPRSPVPSARRTRSSCPKWTTCSTRTGRSLQEEPVARSGRRQGPRHRRRRRGDRRDHQLHQHLEPRRADRRRPRRQEGRRAGPQAQALGQDLAGPGSQVVTDYLEKAGLQSHLDNIGFNLVGYGCTTCIGNSGPLAEPISKAINENGIVAASVISGNRNFEGRVSPDVRANFLASPPLVVAYALKGTVVEDFTTTPIGTSKDGADVYLKDIWPTNAEVHSVMAGAWTADVPGPLCRRLQGRQALAGDQRHRFGNLFVARRSTYVANPPYFEGMTMTPAPVSDIVGAKPLLILGDLDHHRPHLPAGSIKADSPAGKWLQDHQVAKADFNSYGARRGHHEVMMRGTFANIRIKNEMVPGTEGGFSRYGDEVGAVYDVAQKHKADGTPMVVIAGKEYGTGSSRDWAAKGTNLLGVRAVIVESFERIHRSNLVGMGVLPLQFVDGQTRQSLGLTGDDAFTIEGVADLQPRQTVTVKVTRADGSSFTFEALCRIDTANELEYFNNGGILHYVLRKLAA